MVGKGGEWGKSKKKKVGVVMERESWLQVD